MKPYQIMSIDTYGLPTEQYKEFFVSNVKLAAQLYLDTCNILTAEGVGNMDFKTIKEIYTSSIYSTNDDCRRYQKANNPEAIKESELFLMSPSKEELLEEIKSTNAKVDALTDYIADLVKVTSNGLTGLVD